ncbi:hypothetical protein V8F20_004641 [Naviculisporaceae sp. PSN 640]
MLHNATRSPLARLADDILLRIMSQGNDVDVLCLRRTCRKLLLLIPGPDFSRLHDGYVKVYSAGYPVERVPEAAKD